MPLFLYQAGDSWLHRCSPGPKLIALAVISVGALWWFPSSVEGLGLVLAFSVALLWSTRVGALAWWHTLRWPLLVIALFTLANGLMVGSEQLAARTGARLFVLLALAAAVTATTPTREVLTTVERALRPLERRGGVHAQKVAFVLALTITLVPVLAEQFRLTRDAQLARGGRAGPLTLLTPLLVRTLKLTEELGDAVDARGFPRARLERHG